MSTATPKVAAFLTVAEQLDAGDVFWWLSDGSVLGCIREGRFLDSDGDVDIGCWAGDVPKVKGVVEGTLRRDTPGQIQYRVAGVKVDIHGHFRGEGRVWYPLGPKGEYRYSFDERIFDRFETRRFYGRSVWVPSPPEDYLEAHYGPDWRTPKTGWKWNASPPCLT